MGRTTKPAAQEYETPVFVVNLNTKPASIYQVRSGNAGGTAGAFRITINTAVPSILQNNEADQ